MREILSAIYYHLLIIIALKLEAIKVTFIKNEIRQDSHLFRHSLRHNQMAHFC